MTDKPKIYITQDKDGMYLWFSIFKPTIVHGVFKNDMAATKTRLPQSWFGGILQNGECREIDIEYLLCQATG